MPEAYQSTKTQPPPLPALTGQLLARAIRTGDWAVAHRNKRYTINVSSKDEAVRVQAWLREYYPEAANRIEVECKRADTH